MSTQEKHPKHIAMTPIPVSALGRVYHHQSGPSALNPELLKRVDVGALVDYLLHEEWKGRCEIVPNYVAPYARGENPKPAVVVRYLCRAQNDNQEDTYSYLRYSQGPLQGFFWDIYGDDLDSVELAIVALMKAPTPTYSGPLVLRMSLPTKGADRE